jgi:hypothetical protein
MTEIDLSFAQATPSIPLFQPMLAQWNPPLSGDIDIQIDRNGQWWHEGSVIKRDRIVRLFSSIIRHQEGDYFLVTPVEKWRIKVANLPLVIKDFVYDGSYLELQMLTGHTVRVDDQHSIELRDDQFVVNVYHDVEAAFSRACYYRFVDWLEQRDFCFKSGSYEFSVSNS